MREPSDALRALTEAVGTALHADAAVVRVREDGSGDLVARTVWAASSALSAELVGSRHRPGALGGFGPGDLLLELNEDATRRQSRP